MIDPTEVLSRYGNPMSKELPKLVSTLGLSLALCLGFGALAPEVALAAPVPSVVEDDVVRSETIPYEHKVIESSTLPQGTKVIIQKGENGSRDFYEVAAGKNSPIAGAKTIKERISKEPVAEVTLVGTAAVVDGVSDKSKAKKKAEDKAAAERAAAEEEARKEKEAAENSLSVTSAPSYTGGGSKEEWMTAAGIPEGDWGYVDYIVSHESGWNPNAVNASSGASGLVQALPCGKVPGNCFDPVDNLKWADGYAKGRYGSWAGAYQFWISNHWW